MINKIVKIYNKDNKGDMLPINERICFNCKNNFKICSCSIYSGNTKLKNMFRTY